MATKMWTIQHLSGRQLLPMTIEVDLNTDLASLKQGNFEGKIVKVHYPDRDKHLLGKTAAFSVAVPISEDCGEMQAYMKLLPQEAQAA